MSYHVEKSILINASVDVVTPHIADFSKWLAWSPWKASDPSMEHTENSGQPGVVGHTMAWKGDLAGSGRQELVGREDNMFLYELEFYAPMKTKAYAAFRLEEKEGGTHVTWTMEGKLPFFLFFLKSMMQNLVAMDYDRGLRMLKSVVETGSVPATTTNEGVQTFDGFSYVGIKRTMRFDDVPDAMSKDFDQIIEDVVMKAGKSARHWVVIYPKMSLRTLQTTYIAAVSSENLADVELGPEYIRGKIDSGKMLEIKHHGPYDFLGTAWTMGSMFMRKKKLKSRGKPFEYYWNSPRETEPNDLETSVYFPVKD